MAIASGKTGSGEVSRVGDVVQLMLTVTKSTPFAQNELVCTVPSGFRPSRIVWALMPAIDDSVNHGAAELSIDDDGLVRLVGVTWTSVRDCRWLQGALTYIV